MVRWGGGWLVCCRGVGLELLDYGRLRHSGED